MESTGALGLGQFGVSDALNTCSPPLLRSENSLPYPAPSRIHACSRMASAARKRARTGGGGEGGEEPVPVADGFEAPIFGARVVGLSTTSATKSLALSEARFTA